MPYTYEESEEYSVAVGMMYSTSSETVESYSKWLSNPEWFFFCLFCADSDALEEKYKSSFEDGNYTAGVKPMRVYVTDAIDSTVHTLYYAVNLGIDEDPSINTGTATIGSYSSFYYVEYTTSEKDALLTQYKRYATAGADQGSELSDALESSVLELVTAAVGGLGTTLGALNFKKTPTPVLSFNGLSALSGRRANVGIAESTTMPTTSNVSSTTMGAY